MHVHFVAVAGTGMGSLAGLFKEAGHQVSGSDTAFHAPMGPALARWGVDLKEGFRASNLELQPDLVVVGNVCRANNVEARAAIDGGMNVQSMTTALSTHILKDTSSLVVAGTHGKTTTSSICAWLLQQAGRAPGFLIGGLPKNFDRSSRLPQTSQRRSLHLTVAGQARRACPFVIEGDEYDTAFFDKTPKFWHYKPDVAIITSVEHDHIDIYPDEAGYAEAFAEFIRRIPESGLIVAFAGDAKVVQLVEAHRRAPVAWYALDRDETHGMPPHWLASPAGSDHTGQSFDLFVGGSAAGRAALKLSGAHNQRNALAALAAVCQGYGVPLTTAVRTLTSFEGIARRQDVIGEFGGIVVYDDFAHHPTAVGATLRGLRDRHRGGRLWAVYEPRTATACRAIHQAAYVEAFDAADEVLLPPLGRANIAASERLDLKSLVSGLSARGVSARQLPSVEAIVSVLSAEAQSGDVIALLSNGSFGGIHVLLRDALQAQAPESEDAGEQKKGRHG